MSNFNKIFNSETITGRANVAKATYASFAVLYIIHRLRKRSKAAAKCPDCGGCQNCSDSSTAASAGVHGKGVVTEGTCDPETWKRAMDSGKTATAAGDTGGKKNSTVSAVDVAATRNANSGGCGEEVQARAVNADNQNVNLKSDETEPSIRHEVWGCDF